MLLIADIPLIGLYVLAALLFILILAFTLRRVLHINRIIENQRDIKHLLRKNLELQKRANPSSQDEQEQSGRLRASR